MGYSTDFEGRFDITPTLSDEHREYLLKFSDTRRMARDESLTAERPDPVREAAGLPVGEEGCFFVGEEGWAGQNSGHDVTAYNSPPASQPSLWCQWVPTGDGRHLQWNGCEKFYDYVRWLSDVICPQFLARWGYMLNGCVSWVGEDDRDRGTITVKDNVVTTGR
tara:strand:- start:4926 stop:5417 length:492 start_codon:yes stop_codon:yes gene_type:complete